MSGAYFKDAAVATPSREAQDPQAQRRLWQLSLELADFDRDPSERIAEATA